MPSSSTPIAYGWPSSLTSAQNTVCSSSFFSLVTVSIFDTLGLSLERLADGGGAVGELDLVFVPAKARRRNEQADLRDQQDQEKLHGNPFRLEEGEMIARTCAALFRVSFD